MMRDELLIITVGVRMIRIVGQASAVRCRCSIEWVQRNGTILVGPDDMHMANC